MILDILNRLKNILEALFKSKAFFCFSLAIL